MAIFAITALGLVFAVMARKDGAALVKVAALVFAALAFVMGVSATADYAVKRSEHTSEMAKLNSERTSETNKKFNEQCSELLKKWVGKGSKGSQPCKMK